MTEPQADGAAYPAGVLIRDDRLWQYPDPGTGEPVTRRLRLWRTGPGRLTAVITERGAGMSITEAAERVASQLAAEYPDDVVEAVEHYPGPAAGGRGEHFDAVEVTAGGGPRWRPIPIQTMIDRFGPEILDDEPPPPRPRPAVAVPQPPPISGPPPADTVVFRGYPGGLVTIGDPAGAAVALLHHVIRHSPTGFGWGYGGSGPAELARCLLIAALADQALCPACGGTQMVFYDVDGDAVPYRPGEHDPEASGRCLDCEGGIRPLPHQDFKWAVVADWPTNAAWQLTVGEIRQWLAAHASAHRSDD